MSNTITNVQKSNIATDFLFPNVFTPNRTLTFPVTNAIVSVVGIEGFNNQHRRALMQAPGGVSGESEKYFMLLQALRQDVWGAVQHLSIKSEDVYIHLGASRELCGENVLKIVDGSSRVTPSTASSTSTNRHQGYTSSISIATSVTDNNNMRTTTLTGGLGPSLVDSSKLQSFGSAASALLDVNHSSSSSYDKAAFTQNVLKNSNDVLLIIVIKVDGRTDIPVILTSLRAACAPATNYHHSNASAIGDSTSASASFFRRSTKYLTSLLRSPSVSSYRLVPILHSCFYGGSTFVHGANANNSFTQRGDVHSGVLNSKQLVIDRLLLESLPYVTSSNRIEDAVGSDMRNGVGGSLGDLLISELNKNGTDTNVMHQSGSSVDPIPSTVTFDMDDIRKFFHEQKMRDLEKQLQEDRRDYVQRQREEQQLLGIYKGDINSQTASTYFPSHGVEPQLSSLSTANHKRSLQISHTQQRDPSSSTATQPPKPSVVVQPQQALSAPQMSRSPNDHSTTSVRKILAPPLPTSRSIQGGQFYSQSSSIEPPVSISPSRDSRSQYRRFGADSGNATEGTKGLYVSPSRNINVNDHRGTVPLFGPSSASRKSANETYNPYLSGAHRTNGY